MIKSDVSGGDANLWRRLASTYVSLSERIITAAGAMSAIVLLIAYVSNHGHL